MEKDSEGEAYRKDFDENVDSNDVVPHEGGGSVPCTSSSRKAITPKNDTLSIMQIQSIAQGRTKTQVSAPVYLDYEMDYLGWATKKWCFCLRFERNLILRCYLSCKWYSWSRTIFIQRDSWMEIHREMASGGGRGNVITSQKSNIWTCRETIR